MTVHQICEGYSSSELAILCKQIQLEYRPSEMRRNIYWQLVAEVSVQLFGPIFKGQEGTDRLSRTVGNLTTNIRCSTSLKGRRSHLHSLSLSSSAFFKDRYNIEDEGEPFIRNVGKLISGDAASHRLSHHCSNVKTRGRTTSYVRVNNE